ncbi:MAG: tripartite tricarboxylate transporter permease [Spirochaetaceae bacterium]|nr:tripartite tricarboxylate transporter permease [Spirochaetaceae bacterium]MCF7947380.1 tripartite tricarboxylate transporter permease [Spirochaetia bacterium]MCF7950316.1 tripartite tricarboxylate transporter permease [Spirochaetaceae bacterium]
MEYLTSVLQIDVLFPWLMAMFLGIFVGGIPGLTATMAVALIVPITYHMQPIAGLAMILGVSFTAIFAGDIPATFLRIPGTPASGAAILDGYEMTKQGRGPMAIALDLSCSAIGGVIGILILMTIAPFLAEFALTFTHFEYFWLGTLGLSMSAIITRGSTLKGLIATVIGVLISTIGVDITTGYPRFAFGNENLMGGIGFIPVMIGLFGLSEVFRSIISPENMKTPSITENISITFRSVGKILLKSKRLILQSSIIGNLVGALPGAGADMAAWIAYGIGKKTSKHPEKFGTGYEEGVIAPTSANNASLGGTWIPALVFGIPGDTITAILLGAMMMYGLTPGPLVFEQERFLVNQIFTVGLISQVFLLIIGALGIKAYRIILRFPRNIVLAAVLVFSIIGSYALANNLFDVGIVLVFGLVGFFMEKADMPLPPVILGLILGPMIEENLRIGLIKTDGAFGEFFTRPISFTLFLILMLLFFYDPAKKLIGKLFSQKSRSTE